MAREPIGQAGTGIGRSELLGALSLAIDLGLGMPMETMQRTGIVAKRLVLAAGGDVVEADDAFSLALVRFVGCTSSSHSDAFLFGDELGAAPLMTADDAETLGVVRRTIGRGEPAHVHAAMFGRAVAFAVTGKLRDQHAMHCEAAILLSQRLGMPVSVQRGVNQLYERWDGRGSPNGIAGEAIVRPMRAAHIATLATVLSRTMPAGQVATAVRARAGRQLDPKLAEVFADHSTDLLMGLDTGDLASLLVAIEPSGPSYADLELDRALEALAVLQLISRRPTAALLGPGHKVGLLTTSVNAVCGQPAARRDVARYLFRQSADRSWLR